MWGSSRAGLGQSREGSPSCLLGTGGSPPFLFAGAVGGVMVGGRLILCVWWSWRMKLDGGLRRQEPKCGCEGDSLDCLAAAPLSVFASPCLPQLGRDGRLLLVGRITFLPPPTHTPLPQPVIWKASLAAAVLTPTFEHLCLPAPAMAAQDRPNPMPYPSVPLPVTWWAGPVASAQSHLRCAGCGILECADRWTAKRSAGCGSCWA